jgi:hypothetical protein
MLTRFYRFCGLSLISMNLLMSASVNAFDVVSGGGEALLSQTTVDDGSRELLTNLSLTVNSAVTSETVVITLPAGTGDLRFANDPVAITATNGNFTVLNINQSATQIDFEITGSGTLLVQNIGVYGINFGSEFLESRFLNINFQATNFTADLFRVDTRDLAVGFGGGKQINATHNGAGSAQNFEKLILVSANPLTSEVITIQPDSGAAFTTPVSGSINLTKSVISATLLDDLDDFSDTDIIRVNDGVGDIDFTVSAVNTVADLEIFFNSITDLNATFNNAGDLIDLTAAADFTISSPGGAMPTLDIGPSTNTVGSIDMRNTDLDGADILQDLDEFVDGNIVTAVDSAETETQFTVTALNTVSDLNAFLFGLSNLSATFDDPSNQIDLVANEDYVISSDGPMPPVTLDFAEAADLQFVPTIPNFVVNNGSLTVANAIIDGNQLQFELSGSGELEIQNLSLFATNFDEKGEFFEQRSLVVNALATDFAAELMVVDTTDYGSKVAVSGATGGDDNNIFIVSDTMNFSFDPYDFSTRISNTELNLSTLGGDNIAALDDPFTVVPDNDDGSFNVPLTIYYQGTNVKETYNSLAVNLDNQPPSYDFTDHNLIVLPEGKNVAGINDIINLTLPTEGSGDTITMTADFSSIGGSIVNFVDAPAVDTAIALEEVDIDDAAFTVDIVFSDDAGNVLPAQATNVVSIDLIRPVLVTADILSIAGDPVPGKIGDLVEVALPVDTVGTLGDVVTYDLDLSALGGSTKNFTDQNTTQNFLITPGTLNDVPFNQTLTVYDKALNTVSATTNSLQIDNAVPTFNTSCGATFQVIDRGDGDTNGIADINNGEPDGVFFLFPNKNEVGCDFDSFSIDLSLLTGNPAGTIFENQDADGTGRVFYLAPGNLDNYALPIPIKIFDVNGNESDFLTGPLNLDQKLATKTQIVDRTQILSGSGPNTSVLVGGKLNVLIDVTESDIVEVSAEIEGAVPNTPLNRTSDGRWNGELTIDPGFLTFTPKFITYVLIDDAGNRVRLEGDKVFYITNDTREVKGGGGGSLNFSNISKKDTLQRFTPNQSKSFHDKNQAIKTKSKAQLRLESLRRRMTYPSGNTSRIVPKPEILIDQQRAAWRSRQAALAADATPKKLQTSLEKLALPKESAAAIAAARDDAGEFRLRSTLDNLKGAPTRTIKSINSRTVAPFHRGKHLEIKR